MTVKFRNALNRIIIAFVAAGMFLGLIYSAVCDEPYDTVRAIDEYRNEMSAPALPAASDLIADSSANIDITHFLTERCGTGRALLAGSDNTGWIDFKNNGIFSVIFFIFLLYVLIGTAFKHIFYIHLKDGNK